MSRKCSDETTTVSNEVEDSLYYCDEENVFILVGDTTRRAERVLYAVSALTVIFIIAEFLGGYLANSLAVMTDAGHMTTDLLSFLVSIVAIKLARLKPTKRYSFGFHRAEVLGALISIITIWILTIVLVYFAILRLIEQDFDVDANIMIITAVIGIVFNVIMGLILMLGKSGTHSHFGLSHSHSHNSQSNINIRAAFVHVLGDLVQSVGVLVSAVILKFTDYKLVDPICTFLFSFLVLMTTISVLRDAILIIMEAAPRHIDIAAVRNDLCSIKGVRDLHSLRIWSLSMGKIAAIVHIETEEGFNDSQQCSNEVSERLKTKFGIKYRSVQVQCSNYRKAISAETCT